MASGEISNPYSAAEVEEWLVGHFGEEAAAFADDLAASADELIEFGNSVNSANE
jgi:hypothetical protein